MKSSNVIIVAALVTLVGGGLYLWTATNINQPYETAGLNGSANQGNLQQPLEDGAEGSVIGASLALAANTNSTFGEYLVAYNSMSLYTFSKDTGSVSTCYGTCVANWPPYLVGPEDNVNQLQAGVTGKVDTTIRTDGGIQVTYNGHPLYFYVKDTKSGDTTGQNVGGVWFLVKP